MKIDSINELKNTLEDSLLQPNENANVDKSERILSLVSGAYVFCKGITNIFSHPTIALGEVLIGGALLHRGVTGYCYVKGMSERESEASGTVIITEMGGFSSPAGSGNGGFNYPHDTSPAASGNYPEDSPSEHGNGL